VQYNHDRLVIVKRRPEKYNLKLATVHSWQTTAGCSTHVPILKPLGTHDRRALNVWWTVRPVWLCQQNADDVECRRQMSGAGSQQGTPALFHEDSGRPERTSRNVTRAGTRNQWSSRSNGVMRSDRLAEKPKRAAAVKTDCNRSCSWPEITPSCGSPPLLTISARTKVSKACRDRDRRI